MSGTGGNSAPSTAPGQGGDLGVIGHLSTVASPARWVAARTIVRRRRGALRQRPFGVDLAAMATVRRAALLVAAGAAAALSPPAAAADPARVASATVVQVGPGSGRVLMVAAGDPRVRTVRVPPARLDGLGRGHFVRVTGRGAATSVVRTSPGRARSVSFRATVAGTRRGRPLLRLAPGASVVGPRTRDRAYARGDAVRVTWRLDRRTGSVRHVAVVRVAGGAPSSLAVQAAAARSVVFADEFGAAAGTPADPAKWLLRGEVCDDFTSHSCPRNANVFHDGAGNLVLRARREPAGWLGGGPYSGAFLGTFAYGSGWPPRKVTASWSVPYRIEMRALMPAGAGLWAAAWDMSVDRTQRQGPWELDWAEARLGDPTRAGCYQHRWVNGVDVAPWAGGLTVTDMTRNWHVYSADVSADRVEYRVDGVLCGVAPGVRGRFGLLLDLVVGAPGSWGSGGGQPSPDDPGPWDLKIDHVRVTR